MKLELLTNAAVVEDATRFVSSNMSNEKPKPYATSNQKHDLSLDYTNAAAMTIRQPTKLCECMIFYVCYH
jgi:hypothetical protein